MLSSDLIVQGAYLGCHRELQEWHLYYSDYGEAAKNRHRASHTSLPQLISARTL